MNQHITVQIGKHTFIGGLTWVNLSKPREFKREAINTAIKYGHDCYLIHAAKGATQVGAGSTEHGAAPRQLSLAATIATYVAENEAAIVGRGQRLNDWIGVFAITDELYAFVAVRDGAIMPSGDFLGSFNEAVEHLEQSYGIGGWSAVLGTTDLGPSNYHNFSEVDLGTLLPVSKGRLPKPERFTLRSVKRRVGRKAVLGGGLALLIIGGVAVHQWQEHQRKLMEAELAAKQAELAALMKKPTTRSVEYPKAWLARPDAQQVLEHCIDNFKHLRPGGWQVDSYVCSERGSEALFVRGSALTSWLTEVLPNVELDPSGQKGVLTSAYRLAPGSQADLPAFDQIRTRLASRWQAWNLPYQIHDARMPAPPPMTADEAKHTSLVPPKWREFDFQIGPTLLGPRTIASSLSEAGVRLGRVAYQDSKWTYEGVIYAYQ